MIRFTDKQWDEVRRTTEMVENELGRPILPLVIGGADPMRDKPKIRSSRLPTAMT
ncbi:MAG: hypothetical protein ACLSB9_10585 [Hydrogeniiclostridium mannosilyticum]